MKLHELIEGLQGYLNFHNRDLEVTIINNETLQEWLIDDFALGQDRDGNYCIGIVLGEEL